MDGHVSDRQHEEAPAGGTGLCPEAQADGVPCTELGRDCEICGRAHPKRDLEDRPFG